MKHPDAHSDHEPPLTDGTHTMLGYLRSSGFVGVVLAVGAMVMGTYFWAAAFIFFLALLVFLLDFLYQPQVKQSCLMIAAGVVVFASIVGLFARYVAFLPAPLEVTAMWWGGYYDSGTNVGGIQWKPQYTDVRLALVNRSETDYKNLEVSIVPAESGIAVAELGQITNVPNVSFIGHKFETKFSLTKVDGGFVQKFSSLDRPSILGKRIRCENLPKHDLLQIVIALVTVDSAGETLDVKPQPKRLRLVEEYETIGGRPHKVEEFELINYPPNPGSEPRKIS
jgi:hypothetical protein